VNPNRGAGRLRYFLALGSLIAATCFAGTPLSTVRDCAVSASASLSGLKSLSAACPDLPAALDTLGLDQILYEGWRDKLNVHALDDALLLAERYSDVGWHQTPAITAVPAIVQSLKDEQAAPAASWWRSFKSWIKQWIEHSDSAIAKWIKHLLDGVGTTPVSQSVLRGFVYTVTLFAALAAVFIVGWELKAAGIAARFRRGHRAEALPEDSFPPSPAGEGSVGEENTPAGLLRALVRRLLQMDRLAPTERSLTHRELVVRAGFDDDSQRSAFAGVARTAEAALYGSEPESPDTVQSVTRQGRELLLQLSTTQSTT
jgi:hypothetical protein